MWLVWPWEAVFARRVRNAVILGDGTGYLLCFILQSSPHPHLHAMHRWVLHVHIFCIYAELQALLAYLFWILTTMTMNLIKRGSHEYFHWPYLISIWKASLIKLIKQACIILMRLVKPLADANSPSPQKKQKCCNDEMIWNVCKARRTGRTRARPSRSWD